MQIITNSERTPECAIALGNFDGLHIAHTQILNKCTAYAKKNNLKSGALIFENHTGTIVDNQEIKLLTPYSQKLEIISQLGVDFVFVKTFDNDFMKLSPKEFFNYLIEELNVKALFIGFDYTFGHKALGNSALLKKLCEENDIYINITEEIITDFIPVSSTLIKNMISTGDVEGAKKYLGRYYEISGKVVYGKQNGRKMQLPTANVDYDKNKLLPPDGVYAGYVIADNKTYNSIINIGKNPTFNANIRTLEAHIACFSGDLYDKFITVGLKRKIRNEKKFNSPEELKLQIEQDLINAGIK